ncbi:hypothetical protein VNO80_16171 [Phaseolus coccineus]|uniref:Uncharacterized protein n=1 Tax=Phaseolus coccineus TaxID=3886 RepID=A0AAN9MN09_PHACN
MSSLFVILIVTPTKSSRNPLDSQTLYKCRAMEVAVVDLSSSLLKAVAILDQTPVVMVWCEFSPEFFFPFASIFISQ